MALPYTVAKRRKLGRLSVAQLWRVIQYIQDTHCQRIPDANPFNPFGYKPHWPQEGDRLASCLVMDLQRKVESNEAFAFHPTDNQIPY